MQYLHATSVNIGRQGVMIRGPSGSGKSDLALRLIDAGAVLIADDQTQIDLKNNAIKLNTPVEIAGKIEIRGYGISLLPYDKNITLSLIVDLRDRNDIERMPENQDEELLGVTVKTMQLHAFDVSAIAKIHLVLKGLNR